MESFIEFYQHIPYHINPVAFAIGNFKIDWYSLMYLLGFMAVYLLLKHRIKLGESEKIFNLPACRQAWQFTIYKIADLLVYIFFGLLIGARLGYVFFYNFSYYLNNPLAIISPFDPATGGFIGIYGMSYHGGLAGALLAAWIFSKKNKISFWNLANFVAPAIPAGYFFGRVGNFLNGELWGKATAKFWGMYFPGDPSGLLRHPSQIYEATLEGLALFLILWGIRNKEKTKDKMLGIYIIGYAVARIAVEFFRQPDAQIGYIANFFTLGQVLSLIMLGAGIFSQKKKKVI